MPCVPRRADEAVVDAVMRRTWKLSGASRPVALPLKVGHLSTSLLHRNSGPLVPLCEARLVKHRDKFSTTLNCGFTKN